MFLKIDLINYFEKVIKAQVAKDPAAIPPIIPKNIFLILLDSFFDNSVESC